VPRNGESLEWFFIGFGGIGSNQCILAARIEAETAMVCKLSVPSSSFHWATSSCVTSAGEIAIVIVAGANLLVVGKDLWRALSALIHAKVLLCQLEVSLHTSLQALLKVGLEIHPQTNFNPAPAIPDLHSDFYRASDVFCCIRGEIDNWMSVGLDRSLGSRDCVVLSAQEPSSLSICVPIKPVTTVDTTGDGDSLICAMAFYMAHFPTMQLEDGQQTGRKCLIPLKDLPTDIF
uniref:Carbohydrate kinase PfkB domain-containing protein n=1 Tax=Salmo trutta TaxID=8032 RepID=A0A673ZQ53_SALTR